MTAARKPLAVLPGVAGRERVVATPDGVGVADLAVAAVDDDFAAPAFVTIARARSIARACVSVCALARLAPGLVTFQPPSEPGTT